MKIIEDNRRTVYKLYVSKLDENQKAVETK